MIYTKERLAGMSLNAKNVIAKAESGFDIEGYITESSFCYMKLSKKHKINIMYNSLNNECSACHFDKNSKAISSTVENADKLGEAIVNVFLMMDISQ